MNYKDMRELAFYLTSNEEEKKVSKRDLYYDPKRDIFIHRPVTSSHCRYASTLYRGKVKQTWINNFCVFIGRYEVDVNPFWIIEDMRSVQ